MHLLNKLQNCKIDNLIMYRIKYWLIQCTQCVFVDDVTYSSVSVLSRVPQGTVLQPLLFLFYISDNANCVSFTLRLFADDCIVYKTIKCEAVLIILQRNLDLNGQHFSK